MVQVVALHHATVIVKDLSASRAFYEGLLGLTPSTLRPQMPFDGVWYEIGPQQIHLMEVPNPDAEQIRPEHGGRDRHIALKVADFDSLIEELQRQNRTFTMSRSGRRALFCRDPDNNTFEIIEAD